MTGCWKEGAPVQLSYSDNPKRKLRWTLERVDMGQGWVGVNTHRVNQVIKSFLIERKISQLSKYMEISSEPTYKAAGFPASRFDFLLTEKGLPDCYVEVKNTTLYRGADIQFPDAVTERGRKHLLLLEHAVNQGFRTIILFAVNRPEGRKFSVASDIDPGYQQTLKKVLKSGVEALALRLVHTQTGIEPGEILEVTV